MWCTSVCLSVCPSAVRLCTAVCGCSLLMGGWVQLVFRNRGDCRGFCGQAGAALGCAELKLLRTGWTWDVTGPIGFAVSITSVCALGAQPWRCLHVLGVGRAVGGCRVCVCPCLQLSAPREHSGFGIETTVLGGEHSVDLGELLRPARCWGDLFYFHLQNIEYIRREAWWRWSVMGEELLSRSVLPPSRERLLGQESEACKMKGGAETPRCFLIPPSSRTGKGERGEQQLLFCVMDLNAAMRSCGCRRLSWVGWWRRNPSWGWTGQCLLVGEARGGLELGKWFGKCPEAVLFLHGHPRCHGSCLDLWSDPMGLLLYFHYVFFPCCGCREHLQVPMPKQGGDCEDRDQTSWVLMGLGPREAPEVQPGHV